MQDVYFQVTFLSSTSNTRVLFGGMGPDLWLPYLKEVNYNNETVAG